MGRRGEELEAHALAFVCRVAQKHDAAFLLFLGEWVGDDEDHVHVEGLVQIHQAAVRIDHDGFAGFPETAAVGILPCDDHPHTHEHPGTASNFVGIRLRHDDSMLRHIYFPVNESVTGVFPLCNLGEAMWLQRACVFPCASGGATAYESAVLKGHAPPNLSRAPTRPPAKATLP